ncbi:MAG: 50S ribosomal protein L24 [Acidobacteria bacterium]|nr:MAG: 50S ribosomal protein L24 [Acidobacteriota bacterium]
MGAGLNIRKNDQVQVIAGRDKGKAGRVLEVEPEKKRLYVEHVNMIKRHTRPNPSKQIRGGILEKEGPIHISNVALVCSDCGPTRIQRREKEGGQKVRICAKCGKTLDA